MKDEAPRYMFWHLPAEERGWHDRIAIDLKLRGMRAEVAFDADRDIYYRHEAAMAIRLPHDGERRWLGSEDEPAPARQVSAEQAAATPPRHWHPVRAPQMPRGTGPNVGVGVFVRRGEDILLGRRRGSHGEGEWSLPGGSVEFWESVRACGRREVAEETGLQLGCIHAGPYSEDFFARHARHFVTLYLVADWVSGEPVNREPHKCEGWHWFPLHSLPSPIFCGVQDLLERGFDPLAVGRGD